MWLILSSPLDEPEIGVLLLPPLPPDGCICWDCSGLLLLLGVLPSRAVASPTTKIAYKQWDHWGIIIEMPQKSIEHLTQESQWDSHHKSNKCLESYRQTKLLGLKENKARATAQEVICWRWLQRPVINPQAVHVDSLVVKVAMEQVSLQKCLHFPCQLSFHQCSIFIYHHGLVHWPHSHDLNDSRSISPQQELPAYVTRDLKFPHALP